MLLIFSCFVAAVFGLEWYCEAHPQDEGVKEAKRLADKKPVRVMRKYTKAGYRA